MTLLVALVLSCGCATTGGPEPTAPTTDLASTPPGESFTIRLGETKTVYVSKEGNRLPIQRVVTGEQKDPDTVVFSYFRDSSGEMLTVLSRVEADFITYDCYQMAGSRARQTSIMSVMKGTRSIEMWSDGIKTLRIENIRIVK